MNNIEKVNSIEADAGRIVIRCADRIIAIVSKWANKKFAMALLPFLAIAISLIFAFPSFDVALSPEMAENWDAVLQQSNKIFSRTEYHPESHAAKIAFRFIPTWIASMLGIHTIKGFLVFQGVALTLLFVLVSGLYQKLVIDRVVTILLTFATAFMFVGNVLCSDYRGFFDVFAFLFLVAGLYTRSAIVMFICLSLAYFTDERALIASVVVYLFFVVRNVSDLSGLKLKHLFPFNTSIVALLASWLVYVCLRFYLSYAFGLQTQGAAMMEYIVQSKGKQLNLLPFAVWTGLEGFWILVVLSLVLLMYFRKYTLAILYLVSLAVIIITAIAVVDITRSMAYLLPVIFLSLAILVKTQTPRTMRYVALGVLALCLFPTYYAGGFNEISVFYPLPMQLLRMLQ